MATYEVRLNEIANIQLGYQSRGRIEEDLGGNYSIIRPQDFDGTGRLLPDGLMFFSPTIDSGRYHVRGGDILVQARGQNHCAYLLEDEITDTVASNSFYIVRIKNHNQIIPAYLTWWLNLPQVQAYFEQLRGVSTIPFISTAILQNTSIRIPPIETQNKIKELIQLRRREQELIHLLEGKKNLLIQEVCRKATLT